MIGYATPAIFKNSNNPFFTPHSMLNVFMK